MNLLLDTNIIIDWYTNGPSIPFLEQKINQDDVELSTSVICAIEFLSKAKEKEQQSFSSLISSNEITLYSLSGINSAFNIAIICQKTGLKIPDAIILYTASKNNCLLVTRDKELYQKGHQICSIELIASM
ncbi:MAG: PIN domain-containing protein [bacterium]